MLIIVVTIMMNMLLIFLMLVRIETYDELG